MSTFFHEAGVVVWPVVLFGVLGLAFAARHAWAPQKARLAVVAGLAVATLLMGLLATVVGVQVSAQAASAPDAPAGIFVVGVRESLNNAVVALIFGVVQTLVATYGTFRLARGGAKARAQEIA